MAACTVKPTLRKAGNGRTRQLKSDAGLFAAAYSKHIQGLSSLVGDWSVVIWNAIAASALLSIIQGQLAPLLYRIRFIDRSGSVPPVRVP
jgi:hypothetical protein